MKKDNPNTIQAVKLTITITNFKNGTKPFVNARMVHKCKSKESALELIQAFIDKSNKRREDA